MTKARSMTIHTLISRNGKTIAKIGNMKTKCQLQTCLWFFTSEKRGYLAPKI